jgi:hypothetical protein
VILKVREMKTKTVNKSAVDGRFVKESKLRKDPDRTFKQTVPVKKPAKRSGK